MEGLNAVSGLLASNMEPGGPSPAVTRRTSRARLRAPHFILAGAALAWPGCGAQPALEIGLGAQDPVCRSFHALLDPPLATTRLPVCAVGSVALPGSTPVAWEPLRVGEHERLLYDIEWRLRYLLAPRTEMDFAAWQRRLKVRLGRANTAPHLAAARVVLDPARPPALVYAYEPRRQVCDPLRQATWERGTGPYLFYFDEQAGALGQDWIRGHGHLLDGRVVVLSSIVTDKTHYWLWRARLIRYLESAVAPAGRLPPFTPGTFCFLDSSTNVAPVRQAGG